jgi:hypothetical protein
MYSLRFCGIRSIRSLNKRYFSAGGSSAPNDAANDAVLFKEFESQSGLTFLLSPEGMEQHIRNFDTSVISQVMLFNGLGVTWSLQNPLLKKYDFDADQFLTGAEQALREVTKAIVSRDVFEYATNEAVTTSEPATFLSEVLFPHVYINIMSNLRGNRDEETNTTLPYRELPNDVEIHKSYIVDVKAYPVDEDIVALFKEQADDLKAVAAGAGEYLDSVAVLRAPGEEAREPTQWEKTTRDRIYRHVPKPGQDPATVPTLSLPDLPLGSVLNRVRVRFECEFKYAKKPMSRAGGASAEVIKKDELSPPAPNGAEEAGASEKKSEQEAVGAAEGGGDDDVKVQAGAGSESPPPASNDDEFNSLSDEEKLAVLQMGGMRTIEWDFAAVISGQTDREYRIANITPQR